jgi:hypothetical protein
MFLSAAGPDGGGNTAMLVGMCGASTSDTSRLALLTGMLNPPPGAQPTFKANDITPSVLSGKVLSGIAYDVQAALWGMVCWDATTTYVYSTPDLVTWTLVHSNPGATPSGGLAIIGSVWAYQLTEVDTTASAQQDRLMISPNVAGLGASSTWSTANYWLPLDLAGTFPVPQLVSNGNQLLAYNNATHSFSGQVGFMPQGAY